MYIKKKKKKKTTSHFQTDPHFMHLMKAGESTEPGGEYTLYPRVTVGRVEVKSNGNECVTQYSVLILFTATDW